MKIAHFAPFAPVKAGIYEAARDMVRADRAAGRDALFVDTGPVMGGVRSPRTENALDDRGGFTIKTASLEEAATADLIMAHDAPPQEFLAHTNMPMVWALHGRPLYCFRSETSRQGQSYSNVRQIARWPRTKLLVTFWREHLPYWRVIVPTEKLRYTDDPVVDTLRFNPDGPVHEFVEGVGGQFNVLIADAWRSDVDMYEIAHGPLAAHDSIPGLKVHFYSVDGNGRPIPGGGAEPVLEPWGIIFDEYARLGIRGEVCSRVPNIEEVYRACDVLLTPHRIATRVMAEALSCGLAIIGGKGCRYTDYTCIPEDVTSIASVLLEVSKLSKSKRRGMALGASEAFRSKRFESRMQAIYEEAIA